MLRRPWVTDSTDSKSGLRNSRNRTKVRSQLTRSAPAHILNPQPRGNNMEKDLQLGPEAKAVMKLEGGKVILGLEYAGKQASAGLSVSMDVEQYLDLLKGIIPGQIDDAVIDVLE